MNEVDELLLAHFGTKGMKWGVRRKERKVAKTRRKEIRKVEIKKAYAKTDRETAGLKAKAFALAEKYNLDQDDGGGGDGSPAAKKASREYMKLWDKVYEIEQKNLTTAGQNVTKRMLNEFGEQKLKDIRVRV